MPFFYTGQLATKNDRVCPFCGRASYLWGGSSCDVCDKDSNGLPDKNEPTGITTSINTPSLFKLEEKGWVIVSGATVERIPRNWRVPIMARQVRPSMQSAMPPITMYDPQLLSKDAVRLLGKPRTNIPISWYVPR